MSDSGHVIGECQHNRDSWNCPQCARADRLLSQMEDRGIAWQPTIADRKKFVGALDEYLKELADKLVSQVDEIAALTAELAAAEKVVEAAKTISASWESQGDVGVVLFANLSDALASYDATKATAFVAHPSPCRF